MEFFIFNQKIVKKDEANLTRMFLESSFSLSQKIWFGFGGIPLFFENLDLLIRQVKALKLAFPPVFENKRELFRITKRMLNKNKFYRSGFVHLQLFWDEENINTLLTGHSFSEFDFPFTEEGELLTYSNQKKNSFNSFNPFAFFNKTLWEVALKEIYGTHFQNAIVLNEKNAVCECIFSNIFLIRGHELITPSMEAGCYEDLLRSLIIEIAGRTGFKPVFSEAIRKSELKKADEIFIASESLGIRWILGIENKRYLHNISKSIHAGLNNFLKEKSVF